MKSSSSDKNPLVEEVAVVVVCTVLLALAYTIGSSTLSDNSNKANEVLAAILEKAMATAEKTGTFLQEQAPDVVQQLLTWKLVQYSVSAVVCFIAFFLLAYLASKTLKSLGEEDSYFVTWQPPVLAASGVGALVVSISAANNALTAMQIWLAPKVYLIEYAANLVKGN